MYDYWEGSMGDSVVPRESAFPLDLAANPALVDGWLSCGVGSRILRTNPPAQYGPGPLDSLVEGWSETIGPRSWLVQVNPSLASPWDVATVDGPQRVAADGSTLDAAITSTATTLTLRSTIDNGPWTRDPTDFPLDMRVGGERVTASGIAPMLDDPLDAAVSNGWGTTPTGETWQLVGGAASDYSVSAGFARHSLPATDTLRASVLDLNLTTFDILVPVRVTATPTGAALAAELVARWQDVNNHYRFEALLATSGFVDARIARVQGGTRTVIGSRDAAATFAANSSVWLRCQGDGSRLRFKAWQQTVSEPSEWAITVTDTAFTVGDVGAQSLATGGNTNTKPVQVLYGSFTVLNPQRVTLSARAVNGVSRAWPAGIEVDVWQPAIAAL